MDDLEGDGLVMTLAQAGVQAPIQGGLAAGPCIPGRLVRFAENGDHVNGPRLQAAGSELRRLRAR